MRKIIFGSETLFGVTVVVVGRVFSRMIAILQPCFALNFECAG